MQSSVLHWYLLEFKFFDPIKVFGIDFPSEYEDPGIFYHLVTHSSGHIFSIIFLSVSVGDTNLTMRFSHFRETFKFLLRKRKIFGFFILSRQFYRLHFKILVKDFNIKDVESIFKPQRCMARIWT